jgi:Tfp pilus assembly protein PilN
VKLGIELGAHAIRAVRIEGWPRAHTRARTRVLEIEGNLDHLDDAVQALRDDFGPARAVALAIDLPLIRVKRIALPALSADERRNILSLEPERFFAVRSEPLVPAVRADDSLVFAAGEAALTSWIAAFERLGPVTVVEPGPVALARALAHASITEAVVLLDRGDAGRGVIEIQNGRVINARRLFGGEATGEPVPVIGEVPSPFETAYGAALAIDREPPVAETLLPAKQARAVRGRRRRALALAGAACAAAVVFALASLDAERAAATRALDADIARLKNSAAPAMALQTKLATLERRSQAIREIETERPNPLRVFLAMSERLPAGAFIRGIRGSGADWQVDGYAPSAATVITNLGAGHDFQDVHFLSAMNRAQVGNQSYESFSLAFRYAPTP